MGITRYTDTIELTTTTPNGLEMGAPSQAQIDLINEFRPRGMPKRSAQDYIVVPFLASHNLLNHSRGVWSRDALEVMAATFPGMPLLLNHDWGEVKNSVGFIFESALFQLQDAPEAIAQAADHWEVNRSILQRDGFTALVLNAAIAKDQPIISDIETRRAHQCSTGVLTDGSLVCPHCKTDFDDYRNCEHYVPFGMSGRQIRRYQAEGEPLADYYIRGGALEAFELSLVVSGNYPGAAVISEGG